jgi:small subunit ribosomal protein S12
MATINQIIRKPKEIKLHKSSAPALAGHPQAKGICLKVFIKKPRKPNSAQRKMAQVKLALTGNIINAYIPGEGHNLEQYNVVLVRGGRTKDLPGVKYKCIRGAFDLAPVVGRLNSRSKYGVKSPTV